LQFSLQTASPETFGHTRLCLTLTLSVLRANFLVRQHQSLLQWIALVF